MGAWDVPQDVSSGSTFLSEPGWYHFVVDDATDTPIKQDGTLIDNAAFQVDVTAVAGTTPGCTNKSASLTFFNPKATGKDGGAFTKKLGARALIAMSIIDPNDLGKRVEFDAKRDMIGKQFIAHMEKEEGSKYLRLAYADIFHVDDPEVANQPKSEKMLGIIPAEFRRIGNRPMPEKPAGKDPANARTHAAANGAGHQPSGQAAPAKPAPMDVDSLDI